MQYVLVLICALLFSVQFIFTKLYGDRNVNGVKTSFTFSLGANIIIFIYMLAYNVAINGTTLQFTWFSLLFSVWSAINGLLCTYCGIAALKHVSIADYSLFLMLGSVVIPTLSGVAFFSEAFTLAKFVCLVTVTSALVVKAFGDKKAQGENNKADKRAVFYYFGCFLLNGLSGVIIKIHSVDAFSGWNTSSANFQLLTFLSTICISLLVLVFAYKKQAVTLLKSGKNILYITGYAVFYGIATFLSILTISMMDLSVQQPMMTGGVILFSYLVSIMLKERRKGTDIIACILSIVAVIAVIFIPL